MKRRFAFRLERVLRVRGLEERLARAAWTAAEREAREREATRDERGRELQEGRAALAHERTPGSGAALRPAWNALLQRVADGQARALEAAAAEAASARRSAEDRASRWRVRERERRALEELEKRRRSEHALLLERAEAAAADEDALLRRAHRARQKRRSDFSSGSQPPKGDLGGF